MNTYVTDFPARRGRRLRNTLWVRNLTAESHVTVNDLIWPVFVKEGTNIIEPVQELPGVFRYSMDTLVDQVTKASDLGIVCIAIFPCTPDNLKTADCQEALNPNNLVNKATRLIKEKVPNMGIMLDVALDPYNSLGHDGLVRSGVIVNDETLDVLSKQALIQAESGADILGPSDMMDGRVKVIRDALEMKKFHNTLILSYSAKFASSFYGPFRAAIGSSGNLTGDKKTYQLDFRNAEEALKDVALDIREGADMVMVKPGMPYLDICRQIKNQFKVPTFAYQVSGEYAMIVRGSEQGFFEREKVILETISCFKRAGCDGVLTYFALELAKILNEAKIS